MLHSPYDILMIVWGVVFIAGWIGFIVGVNHIFQVEERESERHDRGEEPVNGTPRPHPYHPAA